MARTALLLCVGLALLQSATPLERFVGADRYGKMRIISQVVTGRMPASQAEAQDLFAAAMKDPDTSVRHDAVATIASILELNAMPAIPEGQQWAVALRGVAEALRPALDDAVHDPEPTIRVAALRGIVGPVALANAGQPLPLTVVKRLVAIFDTDSSPAVRGQIVLSLRTSCLTPDPELVRLAKHVLLRALADPDPYVVQYGGMLSFDARYPEALPLLVRQLKNTSPIARMGVSAGIQAYASEARAYLPEIEDALRTEPDGPARKTLEAAVKKIKGRN